MKVEKNLIEKVANGGSNETLFITSVVLSGRVLHSVIFVSALRCHLISLFPERKYMMFRIA